MKEGSRKVLNLSSPVSAPGVNDRSCLADALDGILDGNIRRKLHAYMRPHKHPKGDTPIKIADQALEPHGLDFKRVFAKFDEKPGGFVYNALQLWDCQMILALDLTAADGSGVAHHCNVWNGTALLDRPHNIIIEENFRSDQKYARMVFDKLYPKET